jgi:hypothetical protein
MFSGTLHVPSRSAPKPKPPKAPAAADSRCCSAEHPTPLAIGIHKPLGELSGVKRAGLLLEWWTNWAVYVAAMAAGGRWRSLAGSDSGEIKEQRSIAVRLLEAPVLGQEGKRTAADAPAPADQPIE